MENINLREYGPSNEGLEVLVQCGEADPSIKIKNSNLDEKAEDYVLRLITANYNGIKSAKGKLRLIKKLVPNIDNLNENGISSAIKKRIGEVSADINRGGRTDIVTAGLFVVCNLLNKPVNSGKIVSYLMKQQNFEELQEEALTVILGDNNKRKLEYFINGFKEGNPYPSGVVVINYDHRLLPEALSYSKAGIQEAINHLGLNLTIKLKEQNNFDTSSCESEIGEYVKGWKTVRGETNLFYHGEDEGCWGSGSRDGTVIMDMKPKRRQKAGDLLKRVIKHEFLHTVGAIPFNHGEDNTNDCVMYWEAEVPKLCEPCRTDISYYLAGVKARTGRDLIRS